MNDDKITIPEELRHEFDIDEQGQVTTSRRALARLCGKTHKTIANVLEGKNKSASNFLKSKVSEFINFEQLKDLNEIPVLAVIYVSEYYALEAGRHCTKEAKQTHQAFERAANEESALAAPDDIKSELDVDEQGKVSISRGGLARLCGVELSTIQNLLENLATDNSESIFLNPFAGQAFDAHRKLGDILANAIVLHYAVKGRKEAQRTAAVLGSMGMRTWGQQLLGWQPPSITPAPELKVLLEAHDNLVDGHNTLLKGHGELGRIVNSLIEHYNGTIAHQNSIIQEVRDKFGALVDAYFELKDDRDRAFGQIADLAGQVKQLKAQLSQGSNRRKQRRDPRQRLNQAMQLYIAQTGISPSKAWNDLYSQYHEETGYFAPGIAAMRDLNNLDSVEQDGRMSDLCQFAWNKVFGSQQVR